MSPSNTPEDEAAAMRAEHRWDDREPADYNADDPRDLPGSSDPAITAAVMADWAASKERQRYWAEYNARRDAALVRGES